MRARLVSILLTATAILAGAPAWAQESGDEVDQLAEPPAESLLADAPRYGVGLRLRYVGVPKGLIELFLEEAASGVGSAGFGVDFVRRKGDFEFSIGLEYESLSPDDGYYVENGGSPQEPGTTDYVEFDGFGWATLDAAFVFHEPLTDVISLRYGGGFGLGLLVGEIRETDAVCTGPDAQTDCMPITGGSGQINEEQDIPAVFPVVNILAGVQFRPVDNVLINLEGGLRTVLYAGLSGQYLF